MNIIEGLQKEINRCKELLQVYEEIGPAGKFAHIMIKAEIEKAEQAIVNVDTIGMIKSLKELENCN